MKFKATWITCAVFGALAAYLAFVDEPRHQAGQAAKEAEGLVVPGFAANQAAGLTLQGFRGRVRVTGGDDGRWMLEEPWADRADDARVRALLDELAALKSKAEVAGVDADLAPFGLAAPELTVEVGGAGLSLAIGGTNPAGDARYLRVGAGPVLLVPAAGLTALLGDPAELRSRELLEGFPWDRLAGVEVRRPGAPTLSLIREAETWHLAAPQRAEADPDAVNRIAEKLRWARVTRFLDRADGQRLEGGTEVRLTAEGADAPPVVLRLAEVEGELWAARSGRDAVFTLGPDLLEPFAAGSEGFRRRKPLLAKAWRLKELELTRGGEVRRYQKGDVAWQRDGADLPAAEQAALTAYLDVLETSQAVAVEDGPALEAPSLTVRIVDAAGQEETARVARRGAEVRAQAGTAGPIYRMPPEYLDRAEAVFQPAEAKP